MPGICLFRERIKERMKMDIKTKGFSMPDGNTHIFIPPAPTETDRGGITAKTRTTEGAEVVVDPDTGKGYIGTDRTLKVKGQAADSEAVGTAISEKADRIISSAGGENVILTDSAEATLQELKVFGRSMQDGVPSPDAPVPIVSVGDKGSVEVDISGKNLCPGIKSGAYSNNSGTYILSTEYQCTELIPVKEKMQYSESNDKNKISDDLHFYDINKKWISRGGYTDLNNRPSNTRFIAFNYFKKNIKLVQLEEGGIATAYEPYRTPQTLTLSTPNGLPGIKVDTNGNYTDSNGQQWICDEIDLERGKYVQRVKKFDYNNTHLEFHRDFSSLEKYYLFAFNEERNAYINKRKIISNAFKYSITNLQHDNRVEGISSNESIEYSNYIYIRIRPDRINNSMDTSVFLEWLNDNNVEIYTQITPIEHDLTPEEITAYKALHTNNPTTVISNDESAPMEVTYVADTKNYILNREKAMQKQISDIQAALISQKISGETVRKLR